MLVLHPTSMRAAYVAEAEPPIHAPFGLLNTSRPWFRVMVFENMVRVVYRDSTGPVSK